MQAVFDGQDYLIVLNGREELKKSQDRKIVADLKEIWTGRSLDKKFILRLEENKGSDGIELRYWPRYHGWDKIKVIRVKINQWACNHIQEIGRCGTRYDGLGNKIEFRAEEIPGLLG